MLAEANYWPKQKFEDTFAHIIARHRPDSDLESETSEHRTDSDLESEASEADGTLNDE